MRSLARATDLLGRDPVGTDDEAAWLRFWNPSDLSCHETRIAMLLGDSDRAEAAARNALAQADKTNSPRNFAIYGARLGSMLVRNGRLEEGIDVARPVVLQTRALGSGRVEQEVRRTVRLLAQRTDYPGAQIFVDWSRRLLGAA